MNGTFTSTFEGTLADGFTHELQDKATTTANILNRRLSMGICDKELGMVNWE